MGVNPKILLEQKDMLVSVKKKIKVPLDVKYVDTPMPAVEKYLKSCVFKDLAEFEGVLINYEDIKIKHEEKNTPSDTFAKVRGTFTILKIEPGRRLTAKFVSERDGLLVCIGLDLPVHIKDKENLGHLLYPGSLIEYNFSRFKNENDVLILYGKKPVVVATDSTSMKKGEEAQTNNENNSGHDISNKKKPVKMSKENKSHANDAVTVPQKATYTTENDRGRKVLSKVCPHCGKVFKKGYNMKIHVDRFHKEAKTEKCEICDKSFAHKANLKQHMSSHGKGKYKCQDCNKKFNYLDSLKYHRLKCNDEEKKHKCPDCGECFYKTTTLATHLLKHRGEQLSCQFCHYKCYQETARKSHLKKCVYRNQVERQMNELVQ